MDQTLAAEGQIGGDQIDSTDSISVEPVFLFIQVFKTRVIHGVRQPLPHTRWPRETRTKEKRRLFPGGV
jgi:hypothetical protein